MKRRVLPIVFILFSVLLLAGCEKFEFDPNQSVDLTSEEHLNYTNINKLRDQSSDSTVDFVLMGDSHIDYANLDRLVHSVSNRGNIDFLVHAGDLTEHGILQQYKQTAKYLDKLNVPYIAAIGNHDIVGNGEAMYRNMFGRTDFSFIYGGIKFIFFNSNSREYGFNGQVPNLGWLQHELSTTGNFSKIILVSHVPFFDKDFDQAMRNDYVELLSANYATPVVLSLNGHYHDGFIRTHEEIKIPHLAAGSVNRRVYMVIHIKGNDVSYEEVSF
jgi:Icc protein